MWEGSIYGHANVIRRPKRAFFALIKRYSREKRETLHYERLGVEFSFEERFWKERFFSLRGEHFQSNRYRNKGKKAFAVVAAKRGTLTPDHLTFVHGHPYCSFRARQTFAHFTYLHWSPGSSKGTPEGSQFFTSPWLPQTVRTRTLEHREGKQRVGREGVRK